MMTQQRQAALDFGKLVHATAVRMKDQDKSETPEGKAQIARLAGVTKEDIQSITGGNAHKLDRRTLEAVARACAGSTSRLLDLVDVIHNFSPSRVSAAAIRQANPLTHAGRRLQTA